MRSLIYLRPPRIAMGLLAGAVVVHLAVPLTLLPSSMMAGVGAGLAGFLVMLRGWWLFKKLETAICPTAETAVLITHDVYALTRNPMYLGMILMLLGCAICTGSLPFYGVTAIYFLLINQVFCPYEERDLLDGYGVEYAEYKSRVRRWL